MADLKQIFKKQGGLKLLSQYWRGGALFTAAGQFLLLGKSRTALELLRLSTQLKAKQKLQKKFRADLEELDRAWQVEPPHEAGSKVFICWFQGMENAPELVRRCYESVKANLTDREVVLITSDNMHEYVQFPAHILEKWRAGKITNTHMADLLRLELLIRYGGLWLDATVYCSRERKDIPDYYFESDLFFYQCLKPGRDGHSHLCSSWLMSAKTNNRLLITVRELCYRYWQRNDQMIDYFLLHDFMAICLEQYPDIWNRIVPCSNATPHILLLRLFESYDEQMWQAIKDQTPFHKLTYKFEQEKTQLPGTFYRALFTDGDE